MKPTVRLTGSDGNVFALLGKCIRVARAAKWTPEQITAFTDAVKASKSYDEALGVMDTYFEVE